MYFLLSIGSVCESAGRDEMALHNYIDAQKIYLDPIHPDLAFPYCGLGSVLYHMEEPVWALRCYLKAKLI